MRLKLNVQNNLIPMLKFSFIIYSDTRPLLKDLYQYITPQLLGLPSEKLNVIEHDNHFQIIACCDAMLKEWLEMDTTASWKKLFTVIESCMAAVSCSPSDRGN